MMGSQAIEAASQERKPANGSRATSRTAARACAAVGACILWLFAGASEDAVCGESKPRRPVSTAPTETGRKLPEFYAIQNDPLLVSLVAEGIAVERQIFERDREKIDGRAGRRTLVQRLDAAQATAAQAPEAVSESNRRQAEQERDRTEAAARTLTSSLRAELNAAQSATEAARIKQRQEQDRANTLARELAILQAELDTARFASKEAVQAIELGIRQTQALEKERDKANDLARELSFLRAELDMTRMAVSKVAQPAEAEIKQEQALQQERARADTLARDLASLRAELDTARIAASEAAKPTAAGAGQQQALERERARADTLARDLTSLRAELDTARIAAADAAQATAAEIEQKQTLERELKQQRDRAEAFGRELTSARAERDAARAVVPEAMRTAEAAKTEQKQAFEKERDRTDTLVRELALARKQDEERSIRLAAAHAEVLQVTATSRTIAAEQKMALASERERADALARELAAVKNQLEAGNRQIAAVNASQALIAREPTANGRHDLGAQSGSTKTEGESRSPEPTPVQAVALNSERSSASEFPPPEAQSRARESAPDLDPKVNVASEGSAPASAAPRSLVDEQRLLARANTLLRQADIGGARQLLEHALERGSARAAFMLAETYDPRVLQSWRARGIPGDITKARELYQRAQAGGIEDAKERIKTLK